MGKTNKGDRDKRKKNQKLDEHEQLTLDNEEHKTSKGWKRRKSAQNIEASAPKRNQNVADNVINHEVDSRALNTSIEGHDDKVSFVEGGHVIKMSVQVDEEQALLHDLETGNDANAKEIADNNNQSEGHVSDEGEICSDEDTDSPLVQSCHGNAVAKVAGQGRSSVPDVNKNELSQLKICNNKSGKSIWK